MADKPMVPLDELAEKYRDLFIKGDSSTLTPAEEVDWNNAICKSLGMNPFTRPFMFIDLPARQGQKGKRVCYAGRNAAEQLRNLYGVSIKIIGEKEIAGKLHIHAQATLPDGRVDEDYGVVPYPKEGNAEWLANKYMTCVTKAKRRVTLSICGLGFLDETEIESIYSEAGKKMPQDAAQVAYDNGWGKDSTGDPQDTNRAAAFEATRAIIEDRERMMNRQAAEAIARDPDPKPAQAPRRHIITEAPPLPTEDDPRTMPADWDKRMGRQRQPGEDEE